MTARVEIHWYPHERKEPGEYIVRIDVPVVIFFSDCEMSFEGDCLRLIAGNKPIAYIQLDELDLRENEALMDGLLKGD